MGYTGKFVFAGGARLTVRWTGTEIATLEKELVDLFAGYGLEITDSGYDLVEREREIVFRPAPASRMGDFTIP